MWVAVPDPSCPKPDTCILSQCVRCGMHTAPSDRLPPSARRFPIGTEPGLGQRQRVNRIGTEVDSIAGEVSDKRWYRTAARRC